MGVFADAPIRSKVTSLMVLVSTTVLILLAGSILLVEIVNYREALLEKVTSLAEVIAENSREPLLFRQKAQAELVLSSLSSERHVRAAFLFRDDRPMARYLPDRVKPLDSGLPYYPCRLLDQAGVKVHPEYLFTANHLGYLRPIYDGNRLLGRLYLQFDLLDLRQHMLQLALIVGLLIVVACLFSLALSSRLQRLVSSPVQELDRVVRKVTEQGDFATRLEVHSRDEIGSLIRSFNQMLGQLEDRDRELASHRRNLEQLVGERTEELHHTNRDLLKTIADLDQARAAAEAANRAKSQFLANMSHEIRTPMIGVLGMTELMFGTGLNEKQQQLAQTVFKSGEALLELLNDLLDFSRIEAGRLDLHTSDFELAEVVEEVVGLLAEKSLRRGLELICYIAPEAPCRVQGDAGRLRQILLNLVGNAVKFTESGEVTVKVSVLRQAEERTWLGFEVADTGIGIPAQILETIFDSFSQADNSTTRRFSGAGLGLAIVKQLVGLMGGEIEVASEPGIGSIFRVELPFQPAQAGPAGTSLPACLERRRILLVEENPTAGRMLQEKLAAYGLCVTLVDNGPEALLVLRSAASGEAYEVAFLDADMAGLGGGKLVEAIAREPELTGLRIVLLAGHDDSALRKFGHQQRINAWLYKPIRPSQLLQLLVELLDSGTVELRDAETDNEPQALSRRGPDLPRRRILLVEDSQTTIDYLTAALENHPVELLLARDGAAAIELALSQNPELVFMDCQMPVLDGFAATRELRRLNQRMPVIALTARAYPRDIELCREAGMNDFLSKPFRREQLYLMIDKWLADGGEDGR